ncbi:hypothetical protein QUB68_03055 [Microcoleus sp. A006_D1]|uniref:hypothetical protein n=1 Tax=Microcoleus sp. A006_D1 TaxID=3055267 RepID=UPI002FCF0A35
MAARFVSFLGWLGRSRDRLLLQNLPHILDRAAVDRYFLLIFVGILTVTNI